MSANQEICTAVGVALEELFHRPFPPLVKAAAQSKSRVLRELLRAQGESERKNYRAKHDILRRLVRDRPEDFHIDSENGPIVGLTHRSGFRIHTRRDTLPVVLRRLHTAKPAGR